MLGYIIFFGGWLVACATIIYYKIKVAELENALMEKKEAGPLGPDFKKNFVPYEEYKRDYEPIG